MDLCIFILHWKMNQIFHLPFDVAVDTGAKNGKYFDGLF